MKNVPKQEQAEENVKKLVKKKKEKIKSTSIAQKIVLKKKWNKYFNSTKTSGLLFADEELICTSSSADMVCRWRGKSSEKTNDTQDRQATPSFLQT